MRPRKPVDPLQMPPNYISEAPDRVEISKNGVKRSRRMVTLKCLNCSKLFDVSLDNAKRIQQKCCGAECAARLNEEFEGGNERHPLYSRWLSMTQRCTNPNSTNYPNYGGRGIRIEPYLTNFSNYVKYVTSLPNCPESFPCRAIQLDRTDNSGNYERGNLRWVDQRIQTLNQRKKSNAIHSKFIGVTYSKANKKWTARLRHHGKVIHTKTFNTELEAAKAREEFIKQHGLDNALNNI